MKKALAYLYYGVSWFFKILIYLFFAICIFGWLAMYWFYCKGSVLVMLKWIGLGIGGGIIAISAAALLSHVVERWESFARHELRKK